MPEQQNSDPVNHPAHYTRFPVEVIDITEHLSYNLGNTVKYACRAGFKDPATEVQDLKKAAWYIAREIARLQPDDADVEQLQREGRKVFVTKGVEG